MFKLDDFELDELKTKVQFVDDLSNVLIKYYQHISRIYLDTFFDKEGSFHEYLVIDFIGGAYLVRNCNWNSCSANLDEIAKLIHSGYYSELDQYNKLKENSQKVL